MDYLDITLRIQEIKKEIYGLGSAEATSTSSKLENLRQINRLLKEQNKLLSIKQEFLGVLKLSVNPAYHTD